MGDQPATVILVATIIAVCSVIQHKEGFAVAVSENLTMPSIHSDTNDYIPLGKRIRLVCEINIRAGVNHDMRWRAPPNLRVVSTNDERIKIGLLNLTPVEGDEHREIASQELIVEQATITDGGTYQCEVEDINNDLKYKNFTLHVRKSGDDYVMLRWVENLKNIDELDNEYRITPLTDIVIEYRSYPANITYYWVNDSGIKITEGNHEKYELTRNNTHVKLRINDPTVYDTGNYTLFVMAGKAEKSLRMRLTIFAKPIVQMESKFVKPNKEVSFTCRSVGFPRPDISFAFVPCLSKPWTNCSIPSSESKNWDFSSHDNVSKPLARSILSATREKCITNARTYNITSTHPGVVYCKATNRNGTEVTQADLLISDLPDAITLVKKRPKEAITVGDHVTIVCSALVYNYTNDITFVHNDKELQASDGVSKDYSPKLYAWQARLDIRHVTKKHEGPIYCRVKTMDNMVESRAFLVEVLDPFAPKFLSGNSYEILSFDLHDPLKLECDVVGTPDPKIVWFKDGKPVQTEESDKRVQLNKTTLIFGYLKMNDSGMFACRADNKMGAIKKYWKVKIRTTVVRTSLVYINLGLLIALIVGITLLIFFFYNKKKKEVKALKEAGIVNFEEGNLDHYNPNLALDEQADLLPYNAKYEFPKERLKLGKQLGTGAFGVVLKASATGILVNEDETTVAVKMVKKATDNEVMRALVSELKIMVHLGQHLNVVNLLGAVTKNIAKRELMVIVEYCRFGNVQNFLLKHRPYFIDQINQETGEIDSTIDKHQLRWSKCGYQYNSQITDYKELARSVNTTDLVCWAYQIASGMEYLASRKVLHGDLAARNMLLCDDNVVKICDFGLARSLYKSGNYKKKRETPLPFKWLALECMSDLEFSTYSDVWAYGIVLWELFSLGKVPYPGMEANQELYNKLCEGYRMDKPEYSNQDIYDIMLNCWNVKPDSRPSFKDLKSRFNAMLPDDMQNHYLELNKPYLQLNAGKMERGETDYLAKLGQPEEPAPASPNYINSIILPHPPKIHNDNHYLEMSRRSNTEESNFDVASVNSDRYLPMVGNNLDISPPNGSNRPKKRGLSGEILRFDGIRVSSVADGLDSESELIIPKPRERTRKHNYGVHECEEA